jgi:hypothetical protein
MALSYLWPGLASQRLQGERLDKGIMAPTVSSWRLAGFAVPDREPTYRQRSAPQRAAATLLPYPYPYLNISFWQLSTTVCNSEADGLGEKSVQVT